MTPTEPRIIYGSCRTGKSIQFNGVWNSNRNGMSIPFDGVGDNIVTVDINTETEDILARIMARTTQAHLNQADSTGDKDDAQS